QRKDRLRIWIRAHFQAVEILLLPAEAGVMNFHEIVAFVRESVVDARIHTDPGGILIARQQLSLGIIDFERRIDRRSASAGFHFEYAALSRLPVDAVKITIRAGPR